MSQIVDPLPQDLVASFAHLSSELDAVDQLMGESGDDELARGTGNDSLDGGLDSDGCDGGFGTDTETDCEVSVSFP